MPPLGMFGQGKRQPLEPPRPIAVTFGTDADEQQWKRRLFAKYLLVTGRLGYDDLEADPKEGQR